MQKVFTQNGKLKLTLLKFSLVVFSLLISMTGLAQQRSVTGKVTGEDSKPIEGATILIKGTTLTATTDQAGKFSLKVPQGKAILIISYVGSQTAEIPLTGDSVSVILKDQNTALNEVVVTGYSTQRKKDITGAVDVVNMAALKSIPTGSAIQALQGQASGVNIISSGAPGGGSNVFIRGVSSFGNTQPLILVDGIQSDLDNVSASDIESMQVLKDAGAAAIYGVRGSNGVIIVTTKKGKSGQPIISYDGYVGLQLPLPGNPFNLMNSPNFANVTKLANPGTTLFSSGLPDYLYAGPGVSGTAMAGDPAVDPSKYFFDPANPANDYLIQKVNKSGTDWFHQAFKPAPMTNHNVTASGGTDKSQYLFSLGYLNQQGTLIDTYVKRYSLRLNTQFNIGKNFRIGENLYGFYKQSPTFANNVDGGTLANIYRMMPIIPVYDIAGNYGGTYAGPELGTVQNIVAIQDRTVNNTSTTSNIVGNAFAELDFLKHFTIRTSFGGTIDNQYNTTFTFNPYNDVIGRTSANSYTEGALYNNTLMWTNTLNYKNAFGKHSLKVLAGTESVENQGRGVGGGASDFFSTDPNYLVLGNGASNISNYSNAYINTLFSLFARADYAYDDKYLLGLTVRRDGSSLFGPDKKYGIFPSASAGWRVSNEGFMKNIQWITDLKLRGSYGVLGSQNNVNPNNAYTLYASSASNSYYDFTGTGGSSQQGFYRSNEGNPNTGWEQDIISNIGIDATFLNAIDFSLEYYKKSIKGLLFPQPIPATAGDAAPPTVNIGNIQNSGLDMSVTYRKTISHDFKFSVGANITTYKNVVENIPSPGYFDTGSSIVGNLVRNQEGYPVSSFFGYKVIGLFQSAQDVANSPTQTDAAPGRFKYKDVNGDGQITPADRTFLGSPNPDFTYGLNLGVNYKAFDLSMVFYGSQGNKVLNEVRYMTDFMGTFTGNKSNNLLNAWTPSNTNTSVPVVESANTFSTSGVANSYLVENGSFLKLKSLIIGYTLAPPVLKRLGMSRLRIYVQSTNLFTITKYTGLDPEVGGSSANFGIDYGNYPNNQRSFIIGVNLSF
jgi:TonB-linked SusC/RagA family outer membrane protein